MGEPPLLAFILPQLILEGDGPSHYTKGQKTVRLGLLRKPIANQKPSAIHFCNANCGALVFGSWSCVNGSFVHEAAMHFYNKPVTQQLELINQSGSMQSDSERQGTSK
jgi:hypothetical protein